MKSDLLSSPLRILVLALFAWAIFVDGCASFYHCTYGGVYSGITQLILAIVLALSWYLVYTARRLQTGSKKCRLFRWTGLFLIFAAAIVLLSFGVYHFSTPTGFRSGLTETLLAIYLIILDVLLYKAYRPTGTDTP